ncbi:MAG: hypothetical protein KDA27_26865 [Candidatus Eisenbacteria bacterium]|uniref:Uncharacterized protein n=1 Tax=Eiseniibacteriota bacterium TaxID=2212470 RepID=A0A956NHG2_UNCEI|nr:hypothetical protein [Candidatus Eisenbacteria bacterium]
MRQIGYLLSRFWLLGLLLLGVPTLGFAVPNVAFQGYLTDDSGIPVTTDSLGVVVAASLWDAASGGTQLWAESHTGVVISDGVFGLLLGSSAPLELGDFSGVPLFLQLAVDGAPPLSRTELHASPFAIRSSVADAAEALEDGAGVRSLNGLQDEVTLEGSGSITITQSGNTLTFGGTGGGGADSDWVVDGTDQYSAVSGNVGIGTSTPHRKLHLRTTALGLDEAELSPNFDLVVESEDATLGLFSGTGGADGSKITLNEISGGNLVDQWSILRKTASGGRGLAFAYSDVGEVARFGPDGNVGIGTTDPIRKLHVMTSDEGLDREDLGANYDVVVESADATLGLFSDTSGSDGSTLVFGEVSGGVVANSWLLRRKTTGGGGDLVVSHSTQGEVLRFGDNGNIGIGTTAPGSRLDVRGTGYFQEQLVLDQPIVNAASVLRFNKTSSAADLIFDGALVFQLELLGNPTDVLTLTTSGATVTGTTTTDVLEITGGSDLAEPFAVGSHPEVEPGTVLVIDPERPGELRVSDTAYDRTVAGIVSGANGIRPGITLKQEGTVADGSVPLALSGRVYCKVDASYGAIEPGDLLTTSATRGHAMRVSDPARQAGAVLGKAMTGLENGRGTVLVLVSLQ